MSDSQAQVYFDREELFQFRQTLVKALPLLETLVRLARPLCRDTDAPKLCASCPSRNQCTETCDSLNELLDGIYRGRGHKEGLNNLSVDDLQKQPKTDFSEIFEAYESCKHIFTPKQWRVVYLYYHDEMTETKIGEKIGKSRSAVNGLLRRARERKHKYEKKLRDEMIQKFRANEA